MAKGSPERIKIKIITDTFIRGKYAAKGKTVVVSAADARYLVAIKKAVFAKAGSKPDDDKGGKGDEGDK